MPQEVDGRREIEDGSYLPPAVYAERPPAAPVQTVNVGIALSQERLAELRSRLDQTRAALKAPSKNGAKSSRAKSVKKAPKS